MYRAVRANPRGNCLILYHRCTRRIQRPAVSTATMRSELLQKRRNDATLEALTKQNLPLEDYTQQPFQKFITDRLSRTQVSQPNSRSGLLHERTQRFKVEAARMAPTKPPGCHTVVLPSYAAKAKQAKDDGEEMPMWWRDRSHLQGVPPQPWSKPRTARRAAPRREVKGARRGQLLSCTGTWTHQTIPDDPFKKRTITVCLSLASLRKPRHPHLTCPACLSRQPAEIRERQSRRKELTMKPIEVRLQPPQRSTHRSSSAKKGPRPKRWTDFVIEFQSEDVVETGDDGKALVADRAEYDPMYSSFGKSGVFEGDLPVSMRRQVRFKHKIVSEGVAVALTLQRLPYQGTAHSRRSRRSRSRAGFEATYGRSVMTAQQESAQLTAGPALQMQPHLRGSFSLPTFGGLPSRGVATGAAAGARIQDLELAVSPTNGGDSPTNDMVLNRGPSIRSQPRRSESVRTHRPPVRPETVIPPSPAGRLVDDQPFAPNGASETGGVRAGGFQRLLSAGTIRHSVSTPILSCRSAGGGTAFDWDA